MNFGRTIETVPPQSVARYERGVPMTWKRTPLAICLFVCWIVSALGQNLPESKRPEDVGFSSEQLVRITKLFQADIDKDAIPGAVLLVARDGKFVYHQALGYRDREKSIPMRLDAIFRIASMTKPITSVAVMMLAEEGKIDLLAPVTQYLPEFKDVKVGVEKKRSRHRQTSSVA
jgi:CubicO group peptidase (beta-lactamase class C family)